LTIATTMSTTMAFAAPAVPEVHVLDNGLRVILLEDHRTDAVALHLKYGVGSRDEREGERGVAHLFEHLMFEGSAHVAQNQFDTLLSAAGGWNNAYTSEDETVYYMVFPSGALDLALFLESDRMGFLDAGLDEANLANQQQVVLQERYEGYADPHGRDWDALTRAQYPEGHPYHVPVIGTVADIEALELQGTRDFWQRHYRPRNAILVLVGNFDRTDALAKVRHWFSDVVDTGAPEVRATPEALPTFHTDVGIHAQVDPTLYVSWPTVELGHEDEPALDVLSYVLSAGRGTRLDDQLYYKGQRASDVSAWSSMSELNGHFIVYLASPKTPLPALAKAAQRTIDKLARKPPSPDEVRRAQRQLVAGLEDERENPEDHAGALLFCYENYGRPDCFAEHIARWEAVTPEDVVRVAQKYLVPDTRVTLSVVPEGEQGMVRDAREMELP
jgi:zinc protease